MDLLFVERNCAARLQQVPPLGLKPFGRDDTAVKELRLCPAGLGYCILNRRCRHEELVDLGDL
jgi:hypothetical protein